MVPTLLWMASRQASIDRSRPEPSWEMSQTHASEHTPLVVQR
jgi:hypothetical protein